MDILQSIEEAKSLVKPQPDLIISATQRIIDKFDKETLAAFTGVHKIADLLVEPPTYEPVRRHRKRRIQKKWIKRYGMKEVYKDHVVLIDRRKMSRDPFETMPFIDFTPDRPILRDYGMNFPISMLSVTGA